MNETKDWIDVTYKASDRIEYYWRFSTWLNIMTIGWLLLIWEYLPTLTTTVKFLITTFYIIGYSASLASLLRSYTAFNVIINECIEATKNKNTAIPKTLKNSILKYPRTAAYVSHSVYAIILLALIWQPTIIITLSVKP